MRALKLLILGGSGEAAQLARTLAGDARFDTVLSLAGRTEQPLALPVTVRRGGFGGAEGLAATLRAEGFDLVVDATHPFAARMKEHAIAAARKIGIEFLAIRRPPWNEQPGDRWIHVADIGAAAGALGSVPRRVFLSTGRNELAPFVAAPQHFYLLRTVEVPNQSDLPANVELVIARGPFALDDELKLMRQYRIEVLVSKNSGGDATAPKLAAARMLALPVVMVRRPELPKAAYVATVEEACTWLGQRHAGTNSARRGV